MIHYHGADATPIKTAIKIYDGRHAMVSFAYKRNMSMIADLCESFAFDNGAFTLYKQGGKYDYEKYYDWVCQWFRHPGFDWALIPDIIGGSLSENAKLIEQWPFDKPNGVPVWHLHEPLHWLEELSVDFPRIAFGSSGEYWNIGTSRWWHRVIDAFTRISDHNGQPKCKVHGLRMLDPNIFTKLPFSSADSSYVSMSHNDSTKPILSCPESKHLVMLHKIEKHQSASDVKELPKQGRLFDGE